MADEFVWMFHEETGNHATFPIAAVPMWTPRGWEPCDPPAEPDATKTHLAYAPATAAVADEVDPESEPEQATAPEPKTRKSGKSGASTGAGE